MTKPPTPPPLWKETLAFAGLVLMLAAAVVLAMFVLPGDNGPHPTNTPPTVRLSQVDEDR